MKENKISAYVQPLFDTQTVCTFVEKTTGGVSGYHIVPSRKPMKHMIQSTKQFKYRVEVQ